MSLSLKNLSCFIALALLLLAGGMFTGCQNFSSSRSGAGGTNSPPATDALARLRPGDQLSVVFSGVQVPPDKFEGRIKEDGCISLPYVGSVQASGKTTAELEEEVRSLYVPKYYAKHFTVVVNSENRFFYVDGEVRNPGRYVYAGEMAVLKAVASASGFTDFAKKRKVRLIRANGQKFVVDCIKAQNEPALDLPVYPNDKIIVPRRLW
jgi:polysaccharide export outer membrane protein